VPDDAADVPGAADVAEPPPAVADEVPGVQAARPASAASTASEASAGFAARENTMGSILPHRADHAAQRAKGQRGSPRRAERPAQTRSPAAIFSTQTAINSTPVVPLCPFR
jgi:hypothetical protein